MLFKMKIALFFWILVNATAAFSENQLLREFPSHGEARGVFLMVHGLNTRPETMFDLADWLSVSGYDVFNMALSGHRDGADMRDVTAAIWQDEMRAGFATAFARANEQHVPLYFLGYSLGALEGLAVIQRAGLPIHKMILFAPALEIKTRSHLVELFKHFTNLLIPSLCPRYYCVSTHTPVAAYNALFETQKMLMTGDWQPLDMPAIIFTDPHDELVNLAKTRAMITKKKLDRWQMFTVESQAPYHHMIVDQSSLGAAQWQQVTATMSDFLKK